VFLRALERKSPIFKGSFCRKIVFLLGSFDKESYLLRALVQTALFWQGSFATLFCRALLTRNPFHAGLFCKRALL